MHLDTHWNDLAKAIVFMEKKKTYYFLLEKSPLEQRTASFFLNIDTVPHVLDQWQNLFWSWDLATYQLTCNIKEGFL